MTGLPGEPFPPRGTAGASGPQGRRLDASMSLLVDAASDPVDPAYAQTAALRAAAPGARTPWPQRLAAGVLVAALGMGTVWATRQLRAPEPEILRARTLLEEEIAARTAQAQAIQEENASLAAEVEALAVAGLPDVDPALQDLVRLAPAVGTGAVTGPGMVVTLSDSPRAAEGDPGAADERVQYVDLQVVTNGLWQAGAEAIAINGHRLTALSAVRFAGQAILVELTPLVGPYRVEAVGDPERMRTAFARTAAARHLSLLRNTYGIGAEVVTAQALELPAVPVPTLRSARPVEAG